MRISKPYSTLEECQSVLNQINSYFGYPKKGTNVGNGPFPEIPETYVPGAEGWTTDYTTHLELNGQHYIILDSTLESLNGSVFDFGLITNYSFPEVTE